MCMYTSMSQCTSRPRMPPSMRQASTARMLPHT
jgi:hypothetical protein